MTLVAGSYFHRKRFLIAFGAGFLVLAMIIAAFLLSGIAFAFPITGIGGFVINANQILGDGFLLGLTTNDASPSLDAVYANETTALKYVDGSKKADVYPMGLVALKSAKITDLTLTKDVAGLSGLGLPFDVVRVWIRGGISTPVTGGYLTLNITGLTAGTATFKGLLVDEQGPTASGGSLGDYSSMPMPFGPSG
ncbi:MAG: hypothetical protein AB1652_06240, partial [Bacillota bacterium]